MNEDQLNLDDVGLGAGTIPEEVTIGAAAPQEQPKRDAFEAVHELGTQLGARIDQLAGIVEKVATTRSAPEPVREQPRNEGGGGAGIPASNPLQMEIQAAVANGSIRSQADLAKFINDKALGSPNGIGDVMVGILGMAETLAAEKVRAGTVPFSEGRALDALDRFRRDNLSDKYFLVARDEFDSLVDAEKARGAFRGMNDEQVQNGLQALKEMAIGRVVTKRSGGGIPDNVTAMRRQNEVPGYRVGSGGGATGSMGGGSSSGQRVDMTPRNAIEKQLIESATAYNLSREEVAESLQALRDDPSAGIGA